MADGPEQIIAMVDASGRRPLPWDPTRSVRPIASGAAPGRTWAVDGSHAVLLDNGALWIVAYRAVAVCWPGRSPVEVPVRLAATVPSEAHARLEAEAARLGLPEAPRPATAEAFAGAMCHVAEVEAAMGALPKMRPGDILLIDGALVDLPPWPAQCAARILDGAARRRVRVLGVAKRSGLHAGGVPLVPAITGLLRDRPDTWAVPVPGHEGVWVARLHPAAAHAFRIDGHLEDIPRLVPLSRDAVYRGYPYPLAVAHNAVVLSQGRVQREKGRLELAARRAGSAAWLQLADFHDVLDRNVAG